MAARTAALANPNAHPCHKVVQFDQLVNFKIASNFTIDAYTEKLTFYVRNLGSQGFSLIFENEPNNIKLGIVIEGNLEISILLPSVFWGSKKLTLEASYTGGTNIISVSVTDGSQTVVLSIPYDLSQIITGTVEVGFTPTPIQVSVGHYNFTFTGSDTCDRLQ